MGEGVKYIELIESGGGSKEGRATVVTPKLEKIVIGVDDTDVKDAGATWTMAHNLGAELASEGFEYLDHIIVQLYPHNPHKTQNCVSIALTFAVESDKKEALINRVIEILKRDTLSDKTAIAILEGLEIPKKLRDYSIATKSGMMDVETAEAIAKELDIDLIAVTGNQGKIGALAALGLYNDVEEAVKAYDENKH
jgi:methanogenesis imperfect marker protein 11